MIEFNYETLTRYSNVMGKNATARTQEDKNFLQAFENALHSEGLTTIIQDAYKDHWTSDHINHLRTVVDRVQKAVTQVQIPEQPIALPADGVSRWMADNAQAYHRSQGCMEELRSLYKYRDRHRHLTNFLLMFAGASSTTQFGSVTALLIDDHPVPGLLAQVEELLELCQSLVRRAEYNQDVMSRRLTAEMSQLPYHKGVSTNVPQ